LRAIGGIARRACAFDLCPVNDFLADIFRLRQASIARQGLSCLRLHGEPDQLGGAMEVEFFPDVGAMDGDGFAGDVKQARDFLERTALSVKTIEHGHEFLFGLAHGGERFRYPIHDLTVAEWRAALQSRIRPMH